MGPAKGRESQRDHIRRVVHENRQAQYQPQNFNLAVLMPNWSLRISRSDESQLWQEFFACAESVDTAWFSNPGCVGRAYTQSDLSTYVVMRKYFHAIRCIGVPRTAFVGLT
jgi:hypothetical protein